MRQIFLDTETTGLRVDDGNRILEVAAVEMCNRKLSPPERHFHRYINPERESEEGALNVHGLTTEFLADKPKFAEIAPAMLDFLGDDPVVAHNAPFDFAFLDFELKRAGHAVLPRTRMVDTLVLAKKRFPGLPNSLDALCRRFGVDNSRRDKHGALLDSEILAEVYLELIGGRQPDLVLAPAGPTRGQTQTRFESDWRPKPRPTPLPPRLTEAESAAHEAFLAKLGDASIWKRRLS